MAVKAPGAANRVGLDDRTFQDALKVARMYDHLEQAYKVAEVKVVPAHLDANDEQKRDLRTISAPCAARVPSATSPPCSSAPTVATRASP